jgi:hypothetical protein
MNNTTRATDRAELTQAAEDRSALRRRDFETRPAAPLIRIGSSRRLHDEHDAKQLNCECDERPWGGA